MHEAELTEEESEAVAQKIEQLDAFGKSLSKLRAKAIEGKQATGVENDWREDEQYFEGEDEATKKRGSAWESKPPGKVDAKESGGDTRSTVFVNITNHYVDAASARVADMLLPVDDRNFSLEATPLPDGIKSIANGKLTAEEQARLHEKFPDKMQFEQAVIIAGKEAANLIKSAKDKAKLAETQIEDWFLECQYYGEVRKVIEDAARIGTGILKGPVPVKKKIQLFEDGEIVIREEIRPASSRVDAWNFFPDPACGEDIHSGAYVWERDYLTKKGLMGLIGLPGYIESQIRECIKEGPTKATSEAESPSTKESSNEDRYEVWYYHGIADKEDLEAAGCECVDDEIFDVCVTMVNDRVIKATPNHLDSGAFPYDVMPWQRKKGRWAGIGVARQVRTAQRIVNAGWRNMMDNAGMSSAGMYVMRAGALVPADGEYTVAPRKMYFLQEGSDIDDARKALTTIETSMHQGEMMNIIQAGLKMAEEVSGLPMLLQGQQGGAPETVGGMQILNNNGTSILRRIARLFDDCITSPHVSRYYAWLMQYGEEEYKGDYQIFARGSSALVERDGQKQSLVNMAQIVWNPASGLDPKKWVKEVIKSQRMDPANLEYTEEELKKLQQQQQQSAEKQKDPRVEAAMVNAQVEENKTTAKLQAQATESEKDRQLEIFLKQMDEKIQIAKLAGQKNMSLDEIKAGLSETALKLRTQLKLGGVPGQVEKPQAEPPGKAPIGQSYAR